MALGSTVDGEAAPVVDLHMGREDLQEEERVEVPRFVEMQTTAVVLKEEAGEIGTKYDPVVNSLL